MSPVADPLTIAQELAAVTKLIEDDDVSTALGRFVTRVVRSVEGCDHATIHCFDADTRTARTLTGSGPDTLPVFDGGSHSILEFGPVGETLVFSEPRRLDDVDAEDRWPEFRAAMTRAGYRSCLVIPIPSARQDQRASFAMLSRTAGQFGDTALDMALLFTLNAGVIFDNASLYHDSRQLVEQLRTAISTQRTIGQAQGLVARSTGVDTEGAFELLKKASQNTNVKLRDVAQALVTAHDRGDLHPELSRFGLA